MGFLIIFSVLFFAFVIFPTIMIRLMEGKWPGWTDRRAPRPSVRLAMDVLESPTGWSVVPYSLRDMTHVSGLTIGVKYDETVEKMTVNGQVIPLRASEKRALTKRMKATTERRNAMQSEAALKAWAGNVQKYVDNVVSINRKAS